MCRSASFSCGRMLLFSFQWQDSCTYSLSLVRVYEERNYSLQNNVAAYPWAYTN